MRTDRSPMPSTGLRNVGLVIVGLAAISLFAAATISLGRSVQAGVVTPIGFALTFLHAPLAFWLLAGSIGRGTWPMSASRGQTASAAIATLIVVGVSGFGVGLAPV